MALNESDHTQVWILEDDVDLQDFYQLILEDTNYQLSFFSRISDFVSAYKQPQKSPRLLIADLMLEDGNFLNYLKNEDGSIQLDNLPFMIVSSLDDIDSLRTGFDFGAIDYLTKPFKRNELQVKMEKILRGGQGEINIDPSTATVKIKGKQIDNLTSKELQLLSLFLKHSNWQVKRNQIVEKLWGKTTVHPKTVDVHLYNLRRKLHPHGFLIRSDGGGIWSLLSDRVD